jgi:hypothetical protein
VRSVGVCARAVSCLMCGVEHTGLSVAPLDACLRRSLLSASTAHSAACTALHCATHARTHRRPTAFAGAPGAAAQRRHAPAAARHWLRQRAVGRGPHKRGGCWCACARACVCVCGGCPRAARCCLHRRAARRNAFV